MNIGLDFDGVLSDCGRLKSDGAKQLYGVDIQPQDFKKELVTGRGLLTLEQYRELQRRVYSEREIGLSMAPVDGVLDFLPRLLAQGHVVRVITSRESAALAVAQEWTRGKGLELDFVGVGYGKSKAAAAAGFDVYIDDDLAKLEPLVDVVPFRFLFSWGYNKHIDVGTVAQRVASWREFYDAIQEIGDDR